MYLASSDQRVGSEGRRDQTQTMQSSLSPLTLAFQHLLLQHVAVAGKTLALRQFPVRERANLVLCTILLHKQRFIL